MYQNTRVTMPHGVEALEECFCYFIENEKELDLYFLFSFEEIQGRAWPIGSSLCVFYVPKAKFSHCKYLKATELCYKL